MSGKARALLAFVVVGLFALLLSVRGISNFVTDYLWFDASGFNEVWRTVLAAKIILAVIFIAFFSILCWVNLWLADRLAPQYREASPEEEAVLRFREVIGSRWGLVRVGITGLFAISIGAGAASQWRNWLLFNNSVSFEQVDPQFGRDISFYVFRMPFLNFVASWLFTALLVVLVLTIAMHYMAGGIRIQSVTERVTPQVKAHVSVLLAAMALVRAVTYWLDRYALSYSTDGKFSGLSYTDVKARLPVLNLLILIAILSVVLFVVNIRRKGWGLPAVAVGLWALVSIVMGGIYPVVVQRFSVDPDETTKEAPYVERNIAATKEAFGLGVVDQRIFEYDENLDGRDLQASERNVASVPLLDPAVSAQTFELQQTELAFFQFDTFDVDVDRYGIDGVPTQVLVGARELNPSGIPESGWESEVLSFTHGNGLAIAPANRIEDSLPVFLVGDVPIDNQIEDELPIDQPRIYYGENMDGYAIVDTDRDEVDFVDEGTRVPFNYDGIGGVEAGGFWRRSMFALRFQSIDPLISDFVRDDSRFIWNRNVRERIEKVAPFLEFDHNPYPVAVDGRVVYVLDAYTTSNNYPYSEVRERRDVDSDSGLRRQFNYVRNSVKATVDAYDGTVNLYVVDSTDPIVTAWQQIFPDVLQPFSEMPEALIDNLRYPEDIFTVQTNMWSKYHIDNDETADFLEGSDEWSIAQDPGGVKLVLESGTNADGEATQSEFRVRPYYSLLRLPGETKQDFVIFRSFVPFSNDDAVKEMKAFMVGVSEPGSENYGRLVSFEIDNIDGDNEAPAPALVASQITSQDRISERISLLNAKDEGSSVEFGDLIVLPIDSPIPVSDDAARPKVPGSLIYVRPLYVIATNTKQPNLEWVIVSHADSVVMCHTLADSVRALFGVQVRGLIRDTTEEGTCVGDIVFTNLVTTFDGEDGPTIGDGSPAEEALQLLRQAQDAIDRATELLAASQSSEDDAAGTSAEEADGDAAAEAEEPDGESDTTAGEDEDDGG